MPTHGDFMRAAIRLADWSVKTNKGGPFGAVVVRDKRIIGRGYNAVTTTNDPTAHAEVVAIRDACKHLRDFHLTDCVIYTNCEPCPMCLGAIHWARIKRIYYANTRLDAAAIGFDDAAFYKEMQRPVSQRQIAMTQLLHSRARATFTAWQRKADKVPY
jgi:guanine deaminase